MYSLWRSSGSIKEEEQEEEEEERHLHLRDQCFLKAKPRTNQNAVRTAAGVYKQVKPDR